MNRFLLVPMTALALAATACGGSGSEPDAGGSPSDGTRTVDDLLNVSTDQWETDFSKHTVSLSEFMGGGPGKDGIPAIDDPEFVGVEDATKWVEPQEPVVEVVVGGEARAYPIQILIWHEIANDRIGDTPVSVTFCPLCNTALAFDRRLDGRVLDFGTTGNLRNSDLVMYDRETESWWQQFGGEAVVGQLAGEKLTPIPSRIVAMSSFAGEHPDGLVLDRPEEGGRPYGQNPYAGYDDVSTPPFFSAANSGDRRLQPKERVVFVELGGEAVAVPVERLREERRVEVVVGGEPLVVTWEPGVGSPLDAANVGDGRDVGQADVRDASGELVTFDTPFWFAVAAFRPDVRIAE